MHTALLGSDLSRWAGQTSALCWTDAGHPHHRQRAAGLRRSRRHRSPPRQPHRVDPSGPQRWVLSIQRSGHDQLEMRGHHLGTLEGAGFKAGRVFPKEGRWWCWRRTHVQRRHAHGELCSSQDASTVHLERPFSGRGTVQLSQHGQPHLHSKPLRSASHLGAIGCLKHDCSAKAWLPGWVEEQQHGWEGPFEDVRPWLQVRTGD